MKKNCGTERMFTYLLVVHMTDPMMNLKDHAKTPDNSDTITANTVLNRREGAVLKQKVL